MLLSILVAWGSAALAQDDSAPRSFEEIVWDIEQAGRSADERRLEDLVTEIDAILRDWREDTTCWRLLKSTVLAELSRYDDARESLEVLDDTCPIWEVLNNLAVLEARDGDFGPARDHLVDAIGKAAVLEKPLPQGNLRSLVEGSGTTLPSLILAGVPLECAEAPPVAQCEPVEEPVPPEAEYKFGTPPSPPDAEAERIREMIRRSMKNLPRGLNEADVKYEEPVEPPDLPWPGGEDEDEDSGEFPDTTQPGVDLGDSGAFPDTTQPGGDDEDSGEFPGTTQPGDDDEDSGEFPDTTQPGGEEEDSGEFPNTSQSGGDEEEDAGAFPTEPQPAIESEDLPVAPEASTGPEEAPLASPDGAEAAIRQAIETWRSAWQGRRSQEYRGLYLDDGRLPANRLNYIDNKERIEVDLTEPRIEAAADGGYVARFTQTYCGYYPAQTARQPWGSKVAKRLEFERVGSDWKISREKVTDELTAPSCD